MKHTGTQTITTPRLTLRRFTLDDAQAMFNNWANDERVTKYLSWQPHTNAEESSEKITEWLGSYEKDDYYLWAIEYENTVIGSIGAHNINDKQCRCEIGYCMGVKYWNKGIMTEACKAIIDYLFEKTEFNRICARHSVPNVGSGRVMQKSGMTFEGISRQQHKMPDGTYVDNASYSILREEWVNYIEYPAFLAYPYEFNGFVTLPELNDGEISLVCVNKQTAIPEKKWVPGYGFLICRGSEAVGKISLRIGYTEGLFYGGNIGYEVNEEYRGRGIAGRACRLLIPVAKAHGMKILRISNDVNNPSSRRVCEKLGARLIRTARLPEWTDMYKEGHRYENLFDWDID